MNINGKSLCKKIAALTVFGAAFSIATPPHANAVPPTRTSAHCRCLCDAGGNGVHIKFLYFNQPFCPSEQGKRCSFRDKDGVDRNGTMTDCAENPNEQGKKKPYTGSVPSKEDRASTNEPGPKTHTRQQLEAIKPGSAPVSSESN